MPNPAQKIAALMVEELPAPDDPQWSAKMRAIITRGHTAAWLAATAERLGVKVDSPLLSRARLSRAERAEIKAIVEKQLEYLKGFEQARGEMSEQAIQARSDLYPGAVSQTYYAARWGDWDIPDELLPGNQECITRCLCTISVKDNGDGTGTLTRRMGGTEHHCGECPPLEGEHEVERRDAGATKQTAQERAIFAALDEKGTRRTPKGSGGGASAGGGGGGSRGSASHSAAADAAHQRMLGMEHEIEQHKEGLREQRRANWDRQAELAEQFDSNLKNGMSPDHPDMKAIDAELAHLGRENQRLLNETLAADNMARNALKVDGGGGQASVAFDNSVSPERRQEIQDVSNEVMALTSSTGLNGKAIAFNERAGERAHAIDSGGGEGMSSGRVVLSPTDGPRTIAHEVGHHIEFRNPEIQRRANEFYERRTRGEQEQSLRELTGNEGYQAHETAKPDRFMNPYMGKRYPHGPTEIISMGVEYFYADPTGMAKNDPDYFKFIYDVLRS